MGGMGGKGGREEGEGGRGEIRREGEKGWGRRKGERGKERKGKGKGTEKCEGIQRQNSSPPGVGQRITGGFSCILQNKKECLDTEGDDIRRGQDREELIQVLIQILGSCVV
jgi:hypothetical protein